MTTELYIKMPQNDARSFFLIGDDVLFCSNFLYSFKKKRLKFYKKLNKNDIHTPFAISTFNILTEMITKSIISTMITMDTVATG